LLPAFALTLFLGAGLLFLVEPMVGKRITPLLGGTPAVWNTCTVFFQATLLAGYAYAHAATARLGARRQARWHLAVLLLPLPQLLLVPFGVVVGLPPLADAHPVAGVLLLLLASVGLPFFVLAAGAPLLQKWFAATGHPAARDPYFLYGASNLGSLLALAAYPTLIEPTLRLADQTRLWRLGYGLLAALTAACAVLWRSPAPGADASTSPGQAAGARPTPAEGFRWVALAFVPSSLMLGTTTYLTTDLAAIPLLWVLPLAVYLLSFVVAFGRPPEMLHRVLRRTMPALVVGLLFLITSGIKPGVAWLILAHLLVLFVVSLVCHGELARRRPATGQLTAYYLLLSVGGVPGGLFNALVAPLVFSDVLEYPLALVLACLVLPPAPRPEPTLAGRLLDLAVPLGVGAAAVGLLAPWPEPWSGLLARAAGARALSVSQLQAGLVFGLAGLVCCLLVSRPLRLGLAVGALWLAGLTGDTSGQETLYQVRTFFGVVAVRSSEGGALHQLVHGNTVHGSQRLRRDDRAAAWCASPLAAAGPLDLAAYLLAGQRAWQDPRRQALTYYHRDGPIGQVFETFPDPRRNLAVIGPGAGNLATYAGPDQRLTFYELDAAVWRIAEYPAYFTYLHDARERGVRLKIVLGDARVRLGQAELPAAEKYHLLVVDAFNSDTVPVHLLTREAVGMYFGRLAPDGILAFHISNRYFDLEPVLHNLAASEGLAALVRHDAEDHGIGKSASTWVLLAGRPEAFGPLVRDPRWQARLKERPGVGVWTDDFSNVLEVLRWGR
jgi:hypothetical protein